MWTAMETAFGKPGAGTIFADYHCVIRFQLSGGNPIPELEKFNQLLQQLSTQKVEFLDSIKAMMLISAIPKKWDHIAVMELNGTSFTDLNIGTV